MRNRITNTINGKSREGFRLFGFCGIIVNMTAEMKQNGNLRLQKWMASNQGRKRDKHQKEKLGLVVSGKYKLIIKFAMIDK